VASVVSMKKKPKKAKKVVVNDTRFGRREFFLNETEKPTIWTHLKPGRGQRGESQN